MSSEDTYKTQALDVRKSARATLQQIRRERIARRKHTRIEASQRHDANASTTDTVDTAATEPDRIEDVEATQLPEADGPVEPAATEHEDMSLSRGAAQTDAALADDMDDVAMKNIAMEEPPETAPTDAPDGDEMVPDAPASDVMLADMQATETTPTDSTTADPEPSEPMSSTDPVSDDAPDETTGVESGEHTDETDSSIVAADDTIDAAVDVPEVAISDLSELPGAGHGLIWMLEQCDIHSLKDLAQTDADTLKPKLGLVGQILNVDTWITFAQERTQDAQT